MQYHFSCPEKLGDEILAMATEQRRTVSQLVRLICEDAVRKWKQAGNPALP